MSGIAYVTYTIPMIVQVIIQIEFYMGLFHRKLKYVHHTI